MKRHFNFYNFYDRNLPDFIKNPGFVYQQPISSVNEQSTVLAVSPRNQTQILNIDQSTYAFRQLLLAYYQWMEKEGNITDHIKNIQYFKDVDDTEFIELIKRQVMPHFPHLINSTFKIPILVDVAYYQAAYLDHLKRLSASERFDRFKQYVTDQDITQWLNNFVRSYHSSQSALFIFIDYDQSMTNLYIVAAALIYQFEQTVEIAISMNSSYQSYHLDQILIDTSLKYVYEHGLLDQTKNILFNKFVSFDNKQLAKKVNEKYQMFLVDLTDNKYWILPNVGIDFEINVTVKLNIQHNYAIFYDFYEHAEIAYQYNFKDQLSQDELTYVDEFKIYQLQIDGGSSSDNLDQPFISGGTSATSYFNGKLSGGTSKRLQSSEKIIVPTLRETQLIDHETFEFHELNIFFQKYRIEQYDYHHEFLDLTIFQQFPANYIQWTRVYITDMQTISGPHDLIDKSINHIRIDFSAIKDQFEFLVKKSDLFIIDSYGQSYHVDRTEEFSLQVKCYVEDLFPDSYVNWTFIKITDGVYTTNFIPIASISHDYVLVDIQYIKPYFKLTTHLVLLDNLMNEYNIHSIVDDPPFIRITLDQPLPGQLNSAQQFTTSVMFVQVSDRQGKISQPTMIAELIDDTHIKVSGTDIYQLFGLNTLFVVPDISHRFVQLQIQILSLKHSVMDNTRSIASHFISSDHFSEIVLYKKQSFEIENETSGFMIENSSYDKLPDMYHIDYSFLIKHILDFYQTKGTERSFKFLFKLLFNEDITFNYPKQQMLIASDLNFRREHIIFFKKIENLSFLDDQLTPDCILFLLDENYKKITFGQLTRTFIHKNDDRMVFPSMTIINIYHDFTNSNLIIETFQDSFFNSFLNQKISIELTEIIPTEFNGKYIAHLTNIVNGICYWSIHLYYHQHIFSLTYKMGGQLILDDFFYKKEEFRTMIFNAEYGKIDEKRIANYALYCQDIKSLIIPFKITREFIVDSWMLKSTSMTLITVKLWSKDYKFLYMGEVLDVSFYHYPNVNEKKYFIVFIRIQQHVEHINDIVYLTTDETEIDQHFSRIQPLNIVENNYADYKLYNITGTSNDVFRYQIGQYLSIFDNHGFRRSFGTVSSIDEITHDITAIHFPFIFPGLRYKLPIIDTQSSVNEQFERMNFTIGLDIHIKNISSIRKKIISASINGTPTDPFEVVELIIDSGSPQSVFDSTMLGEVIYVEILRDDGLTIDVDTIISGPDHLYITETFRFDLNFTFIQVTIFETLIDHLLQPIDSWCMVISSKKNHQIIKYEIISHIIQPYMQSVFSTMFDSHQETEIEKFIQYLHHIDQDELKNLLNQHISLIRTLMNTWYDTNIVGCMTTFISLIIDFVLLQYHNTTFPMIIDHSLHQKLEFIDVNISSIKKIQIAPGQFIDLYINYSDFLNQFIFYGQRVRQQINDYHSDLKITYSYTKLVPTSINIFSYSYKNTTTLNKSFLQDNYYYQQYSYEICSSISMEKYLKVIESLVHPVGTKIFNRLQLNNEMNIIPIHRQSYSIYTNIVHLHDPIISEEDAQGEIFAINGSGSDYIAHDQRENIVFQERSVS